MSLAHPCQLPMLHTPSTAVTGTDGNVFRDLTDSDALGPVCLAKATQNRSPDVGRPDVIWHISLTRGGALHRERR